MLIDPRQGAITYPKDNIIISAALNQSFDNLKEIISLALEKANDELINVAINLAPNRTILLVICQAIYEVLNTVSSNLKIIAMPLIFVVGSRGRVVFPKNLDVIRLNQLFMDNNLYNSTEECYFSGNLFTLEGLNKVKLSQLLYWAKNISIPKLGLPVKLDNEPIISSGENVHLRYIVGCYKEFKFNNQVLLNLMKFINQEFKNLNATIFPIIFPPCYLHQAPSIGRVQYREIELLIEFSKLVKASLQKDLQLKAALSSYDSLIEIKIYQGKLVERKFYWHLNHLDDFDEILNKLVYLLNDLQIDYEFN